MAITNINPATVIYNPNHAWLNPGFYVPDGITDFTFYDTMLDAEYQYVLLNNQWILNKTTDFVLLIKTDEAGTSDNNQCIIPITGTNWDYKAGTNDWVNVASSVYNTSPATATFPAVGEQILRIRNIGGTTRRLQWFESPDIAKARATLLWGNTAWTYLASSYYAVPYHDLPPSNKQSPILTSVGSSTGVSSMWRDCGLTQRSADHFIYWNQQVNNVTTFTFMFLLTKINPAIQGWQMTGMNTASSLRSFTADSNINRDVSGIKLNTNLTDARSLFDRTQMSTENYSRFLISAANQVYANNGPYGVNFTSQRGRTYNAAVHNDLGSPFNNAVEARAFLVDATRLWDITSDSQV
jgi:hypothetical protein